MTSDPTAVPTSVAKTFWRRRSAGTRRSAEADRVLSDDPVARWLSFGSFVCGALAAACAIGFGVLLATAVARVFVGGQDLQDVFAMLALAGVAALARAALLAGQEITAQHASSRLGRTVRGNVLRRLGELGPAWSSEERIGEVVRAMSSGLDALDAWLTSYRPARQSAALVPVLVLMVILVLDPPTALVLVLTGPVLVLLLAVIGSRAHAVTRRRFTELRWMSAFFVDMLRGIATLKAFGRSREQAENIRTISGRLGDTTMDVLRTAFQTALVLEWAAAVATAVVATEVSLRLMAGAVSFEVAIAVLIVTPEFFLPLRNLAIRYHAGAAGEAAAERLRALGADRAAAPTATESRLVPSSPRPVGVGPPAISLQGVAFAYPDRPAALRGLSLEVAAGELVALVGPSGAGKSTIANLLLRFVDPDEGTIRVDGVPLALVDRDDWLRTVAWVPQRPHLLWGTAADAIRVGRPDAPRPEVVEAARAAGADAFIRALPEGYDTHLGEGARRLSGGQRQRLALARAFLRDASLVILDEPTSHLDAESEAAIAHSIRAHATGRTVIVIAHRPALADIADRVVIIEAGRVADAHTTPRRDNGPAVHGTAGLVEAGPA